MNAIDAIRLGVNDSKIIKLIRGEVNFEIKVSRNRKIIKDVIANSSLEGRYVLPKLKEIVEKTCNVSLQCEIAKNYMVTMLQPSMNKKYFKSICKYALIVIHLITKTLGAKSPPMLNILLFDLDLPKNVDLSRIPDCTNVNSGFAYPSLYKIVVYRHEEMLKVLIHELLHVFMFRWVPTNDNMLLIQQRFIKQYHINEINIDEGYVDALAIIINTALYAKANRLSFQSCWKREQSHMMQKAKLIITIYRKLLSSRYIKEPTNTISYYVMKPMLLMNKNIPIIHDNIPIEDRYQRVNMLTKSLLSSLKPSSVFYKKISKTQAKYDSMRMSLLNILKGI